MELTVNDIRNFSRARNQAIDAGAVGLAKWLDAIVQTALDIGPSRTFTCPDLTETPAHSEPDQTVPSWCAEWASKLPHWERPLHRGVSDGGPCHLYLETHMMTRGEARYVVDFEGEPFRLWGCEAHATALQKYKDSL